MSSEPQRRVRSATRASTSVMHVLILVFSVSGRAFVVPGARRNGRTMSDVVERGRRREHAAGDLDGVDPGGAVAAHDARRPRREDAGHGLDAALDPRPRFDAAHAVDEQRRSAGTAAAGGRERVATRCRRHSISVWGTIGLSAELGLARDAP